MALSYTIVATMEGCVSLQQLVSSLLEVSHSEDIDLGPFRNRFGGNSSCILVTQDVNQLVGEAKKVKGGDQLRHWTHLLI